MAQPGLLCGTKRPAESDLCDEQPLAKKLGLLHLGSLLVLLSLDCLTFSADLANFLDSTADSSVQSSCSERNAATPRRDPSPALDDSMLLDDTKYTIYIHDLDREIAEAEDQENGVAFLSTIADKLSSVPRSILSPPKPQGNELVLYSEPSSLTVPEEHDCVRRAVIETKTRTRKRQTEHQHSEPSASRTAPTEAASAAHTSRGEQGFGANDAMDIDAEL